MKTTKNLGLKKPEATDFYNVEDFNGNMDTIDEELQNLSDKKLPLEGGTLTGNAVYLADGYGRVHSDANVTQIEHFASKKDNNNRRQLVINKIDKTGDSAVVLSEWKDGKQTLFSLYGTHFKPTPADIGAESMASLPDITTTTTILATIQNYYTNGIKSGRFFSSDNVADNPEKNWSFSIEFFDCGRSLVLVKAYKTQVYQTYYRQLNIDTGEYLYEWVCEYNTGNKPSFSDVEAITYGTHRVPLYGGDNLNDYLTIGGYACTDNDASASVVNSPVQVAFTLDVLSGTGINDKVDTSIYSYIVQHLRSIEGEEYFRRVYSIPEDGTIIFADWKKVVHSGLIVNNLTTTDSGYVLDARQGKKIPLFKSYSVAIPADTSYQSSVAVDWAPSEAFIVGASVTVDGVAYDALKANYARITHENYNAKVYLGSDAFMKGKTLNITLMKIPSQD